MANQWGRKETIIWPPHVPVMSYSAVATAILCTCFFLWQRLHFSLPPLQRSYLTEYIRSQAGATFQAHESYRLLYLAGGKTKPRLALPVDFTTGSTRLPDGSVLPFGLSELARVQGYRFPFRGPAEKLADVSMHRWLHDAIYGGKGLSGVFAISFIEGGVCLVAMLWFAVPKDLQRFREMKYGRRLRGPFLLTPKEMSRKQKGDGIGFKTTEMKGLMRIPLRKEAQHFQLMGDTGVGKTQLIMQMLRQIRERQDSAIVYDPASEYLQRFYDVGRGDIVLNPLDARCPYWGPAHEMESNAEADAIAALALPARDGGKGRVLSPDARADFRPSAQAGADAPPARRVDGERYGIDEARRRNRDGLLHRPEGRAAARRCPFFARTGRQELPAAAGKERRQAHLERPHLGQGTQGMDLHHVASARTRNAPSFALALD